MKTLLAQVHRSNPQPAADKRSEAILPELLLMDRLVELLIQKAKAGLHWPDLYDRADAILGQLWLPAPYSRLTRKRLRNAREYAVNCNYGAAAYELRLVRANLAS